MAVAVGVSGDVGSDDLRMLPSERRLALARACCNSDIFQDTILTLRVPFVFNFANSNDYISSKAKPQHIPLVYGRDTPLK